MSFLLEIKSNIKKYSVIFFVVILTLVMLLTINDYKIKGQIEKSSNRVKNELTLEVLQGRVRRVGYEKINDTPESINSYKEAVTYQNYLSEEVLAYDPVEDYQLYNLNRAQYFLFSWFTITELSEHWNIAPEDYRMMSPIDYFGEDWGEVQSSIGFPEIGDFYYEYIEVDNLEAIAYTALLYLDLHEKDIIKQCSISTRPWSFIYLLFGTSIPMLFGFFALIMGSQVVSKQRENGVIKNKLTENRGTFLLRSYWVALIISVTTCLVILFSIFTVQGLQHGFDDRGHPVMVKRYVLFQWAPDYEVVATGKDIRNIHTIGLANNISVINPRDAFEKNISLPLSKVVTIQILLLIIYLAFWCAVGICAAVYFKNGLAALGVAVLMFFSSFLITTLAPSLRGTMWDLTGFFALKDILSGSQPVTLSRIMVVNVVGLSLIGVAAVLGFRRQDIR